MRTQAIRIATLTTTLLLSTLPAFARCDHRAERSLSESLDGVERVEITAKAGDLDIRAGGSTLEARGDACASSKNYLEEVQLVASRSGSTLRVEVETPNTLGWNSGASLDLEIEVPNDVPLRITDGSGDTEIRGVTVEEITDGSGEVRLTETFGALDMTDGSGDVSVRGHEGTIEITDGSGDVSIRDIAGEVLVANDGSGDLDISQVSGSVEVRSDGSGDIFARAIGGDFEVGSGGSGDIKYREVEGRVSIPGD
ncbi:MAG: DUF4097 family beta strand repeat-containing protein [Acidobacteriota bacterium]